MKKAADKATGSDWHYCESNKILPGIIAKAIKYYLSTNYEIRNPIYYFVINFYYLNFLLARCQNDNNRGI